MKYRFSRLIRTLFICLLIFSGQTLANTLKINSVKTNQKSVKVNRKKVSRHAARGNVSSKAARRKSYGDAFAKKKLSMRNTKSLKFSKQVPYKPRFSTGPFYQTTTHDFGLYDLFLPYTLNSSTVVFADGRYIDRGHSWEYNAGLGARSITGSGNYLWTAYTFYDNRRTRFHNNFGQITVGGDLQTEHWYFNTNGYIPVGRTQAFVPEFNTASLCRSNSRICYARGIEKSMGGGDAEVGYEFWHGLKAYAGMYVFARQGVQTAIGPNLRLQWNLERANEKRILFIFDKIALIANWRDDQLVGSSWYAGARFDVSLGRRPQYVGLERKMTSFIRRDLNIEVSSDGSGSNADLTEPARTLMNTFDNNETQVLVLNASSTDGVMNTALTTARNNIVGFRGSSTATSNKVPSSNQVLEGGTYTFVRDGTKFSVQVGQNGTLVLAGNSITVSSTATAGQNVTVENMTLTNTGVGAASAIINTAANSMGTLTVRNNSRTGVGGFVNIIAPTAATQNTVVISQNSSIGSSGSAVVSMTAGGSATINATIDGNLLTARAATDSGILLTGAASSFLNASIINNTVRTAGTGANSSIRLVGSAGQVDISDDMKGNVVTNNVTANSSALVALDNVYFLGDITGNTFRSGPNATGDAVNGVVTFDSNQARQGSTVFGIIHDNRMTSTGLANADVLLVRNSDTFSVTSIGGIVNNTIDANAATLGNGIAFKSITGSTVCGAVYNNTITNFQAGDAIISDFRANSIVAIGAGQNVANPVNLANANGLALADVANFSALSVLVP